MRKFIIVFVVLAMASLAAETRAAIVFSDNYDSGASPLWDTIGSWSDAGGVYQASNGGNATVSNLGYLTDFTVTVDVNNYTDGGILLRSSPSGHDAVYLILGGGGTNGQGIYWHVRQNGVFGSILAPNFNLGLGNTNASVEVVVTGNSYSAFVNGIHRTTLLSGTFASGTVGLNDNGPASFDNFTVTSDTLPPATVPLPPAALMGAIGLGFMGIIRRRPRNPQSPLCPK